MNTMVRAPLTSGHMSEYIENRAGKSHSRFSDVLFPLGNDSPHCTQIIKPDRPQFSLDSTMHSASVVTLICLVFALGSKANTCDGAATETTTQKGFGAFRYILSVNGLMADGLSSNRTGR